MGVYEQENAMEIAQEPYAYPEEINWEAKYNESVAQHRLTNDQYGTHIANANKAMQVISDMFFDEAEKRDWCKDAFDFVEDINSNLPHGFNIPLRKRKFNVHVLISGTISTTHEVEVEARDQSEADDLVNDCPDDYFDPDEVLRDENIRYITIDNIEVEGE